MKIGARVVKTGIAVSLTMYLCKLMSLEPAFFGAVSAVVNMQPSIFLTFKTAKDQILIHLIGVGTGLLFGLLAGGTPFVMGIVSVLLILVYIKLGLKNGISMGIVAAVFVMGSNQEFFLSHAMNRTGVIFIGLFSAMLVNLLLWPPRYNRQLKENLQQANQGAVAYFCQAVVEYVKLENDEPSLDPAEKDRVHGLNREVRTLINLSVRESDIPMAANLKQSQWLNLAGRLASYNEALTEKADRIYDLLPARLTRRHAAGDPPISEEFRAILAILGSSAETINRVNGKLRSVVIEGRGVESEVISEEYWERLTVAIEQWQIKLTGSYYVHALIEAAVTANEIKWAAREGKLLLQEANKELG